MSLGGSVGPEYDHMVLLVALDRDYLVDVGNGQSFRDPLPLAFRVDTHGDGHGLYYRQAESEWLPRFLFSTIPREQSEFAPMCEFHQTSPESIFTKQRLATIATPKGRLTLVGNQFTEVQGAARSVRELTSESEVLDILRRRFAIDLTAT
jgi:N-hydroxyarylamine O-acetyltransferase